MRRPATALIAVLCFLLLPYSTLFASDSLFSPGSSVATICEAYNSWTASNRAAMPQLAAQWDHYTGEFGAAGAPLFVISQATNPVITTLTGIQPGSAEAKQAGTTIADWTGGVVNLPMKVLLARDLNNPDKELSLTERFSSITAWETITYGAFAATPMLASALAPLGSELAPHILNIAENTALTFGILCAIEYGTAHN
jgi:hypothetical protein